MEYQLLWENRNEGNRSATDLPSLIIFGLLSILWFGIVIYGFTNSDGIPDKFTNQVQKWMTENKIKEALFLNKGACLGFVFFAILLIALYFIMVRWVTKITIFITFILVGLNCLLWSIIFLRCMSLLTFMLTLMSWIIYGVTLHALKKVGIKSVCKVLQDACKTMICFPSSLLIVLLELAIQIGVLAFTIGATVYLLFIKIDDSVKFNDYVHQSGILPRPSQEVTVDPPTYVKFLLLILIGIAIWIICFIGTFRSMLLHGIFAHWYRASDKKNISNTVGLRCVATAIRYHAGTVAFSSTIFAIIPVIGALFNVITGQAKLIRKRPSILIALLFALLQSLSNASVMCISYGKSLYQSTKDGLQLVMRNPLKYIVMYAISVWIMIYGLTIIPLMTTGASYSYFISQLNIPNAPESFVYMPLLVIATCSSFITALLIVIFKNAVEAVTVCFLEESNLSNTGLENEGCEV